jgi:hypothetical protein
MIITAENRDDAVVKLNVAQGAHAAEVHLGEPVLSPDEMTYFVRVGKIRE